MTADRIETAEAEAERRWPRSTVITQRSWLDEGMACGFVLGALWASRPDVPAAGLRVTREGVTMIAAERQRQIDIEGYTAEHDARHGEELARAAASYALAGRRRLLHPAEPRPPEWPWLTSYWKPTPGDRVRELVKAGALIAAAIDSELALGVTVVDGNPTRESEAAHAALCDAEADRLALVAAREEVERLRSGIDRIVERYGNAPGIEKCATMYDLRRLAGDL